MNGEKRAGAWPTSRASLMGPRESAGTVWIATSHGLSRCVPSGTIARYSNVPHGGMAIVRSTCAPGRARPGDADAYFRCLLTSLVISNMFTLALPPNTGLSAASALIVRLFLGSCSLFFLM